MEVLYRGVGEFACKPQAERNGGVMFDAGCCLVATLSVIPDIVNFSAIQWDQSFSPLSSQADGFSDVVLAVCTQEMRCDV
jgi:hypothetical protein